MTYLAQVNVAKMVAEIYSPIMEDFVNNLDHINTIAEASSGLSKKIIDQQ
nr:DUF3291 domain-containing protein [Cellulophaga baltica]